MKSLKWVVMIAAAIGGYILGNIWPLNVNLFTVNKGILGNIQLVITAKMEDTGTPVPNLEIDLASQPGQPPVGGVCITDTSGAAKFNVRPGNYFIYFNQNTFPKNLKMPEPEQIVVAEGVVNEKEIVFFLNR